MGRTGSSTRWGVTVVLSIAMAAGCSSAPAVSQASVTMTFDSARQTASAPLVGAVCDPIDPPDTGTAAGWLGYLAAHQVDVSVVVDDGRGTVVAHREGEPAPAASALKVLHLAAYAQAIDDGVLDPDQPVRVADWEAWYFPGTDGGAHPQALTALGVANDGKAATDPAATVRLDDLAALMIKYSDNAAADYLRKVIGDAGLQSAADASGWSGVDLPSFLGAAIALVSPADAPDLSDPRATRGAAELALAQRYGLDPDFRASVLATPQAQAQSIWAESTAQATASELQAVHRTLSDGGGDASRPGSALARQHLEWPPAPAGTLGLGEKGGSYPRVITDAMTARRQDGTTGSAVLMVSGMPAVDWANGLQSFAHQELLLAAMEDPAVLDRLSCAVGEGSIIPR